LEYRDVISQCSFQLEDWRRRRITWRVSPPKSLGLLGRKSAYGDPFDRRLIDSGQSDLEEPIAIRPTSETVMYPCKSRDLGQETRTDGRLRKVDSIASRLAIEVEPVEQCRPMGVQEPS
jgi:hypothetical protein